MAVNTNTIVSNVYAQNYTPGSKEKTKVARNTETGEVKKEEKVTESKDLGKTIGDPKLSKEAQKYYEKLKKKYVEGEGEIIGDATIGANPRAVEFGSAPVLIRSTRKAGKNKGESPRTV